MAVKTFTAGSVLTAADTNTYLNNGGLVYIGEQTVGTAVSIVTLSSVFSATYDNYRVVYSGGSASASTGLAMRVGGITTNYSHMLFWASPGGASVNVDSSNNNAGQVNYMGATNSGNGNFLSVDVLTPFLAKYTGFISHGGYIANDFGSCVGRHNLATSYTSVSILPTSGTITGGVVRVYGYRQA